MVPAASDRIPRVPPYSGFHQSTPTLPLRDYHPLRCAFPDTSGSVNASHRGPTTPHVPQHTRFGLFPLRSPLLRKSMFLSSPAGTKMFQFPAYAPVIRVPGLQPGGFPHSDTCGSIRVCQSPQLFAAFRVLLRLWKPRHPPFALLSFVLNLAIQHTASFDCSVYITYSKIVVPQTIQKNSSLSSDLSLAYSFYLVISLIKSINYPAYTTSIARTGPQRYTLFLPLQTFFDFF